MFSRLFKDIQKWQDLDWRSIWKIDNIHSKISGILLPKSAKIFLISTESFILMMTLLWEVIFLKNLLELTKSVPIVVDQIICILMYFTLQINLLKFGSSQESLIWMKNILQPVRAFHKTQMNKFKWKWFFLIYQKLK